MIKQTPTMTRFESLSFQQLDRDLWRYYSEETGMHVGPAFKTREELLAYLPQQAEAFCSSRLR